MGEPQKSVISTTENLDITFPGGENLSITKTKHCVTLNLQLDEHNKNTYAADETPTPTRFIRNCEEVGLFQDLQNVNPFDETFKKAIELAKSGSLHVPDLSTDDTLHTPHILPHEENPTNESQSIFNISRVSSLDEDLLKLGGSREGVGGELLDKLCGGSKDAPQSLESSFSISRVPSIDEDLLIIANEDSDSEQAATNEDVNTKKPRRTSQESDTNKALKVRLKEAVQNRLKNENRTMKLLDSAQGIIIAPLNIDKLKNADSATLLINQKVDPTCMKVPRKRTANPPSEAVKKNKNNEITPDKEKTREINRIAQSRSRIRKKKWINEMVKKIDDLTRANKTLLAINEQLQSEISLARNILQYHNDCSAARDPTIKEKINRLMLQTKQKSQPATKKTKTKEEIPIRPAPVVSATPVKIQLPYVHAIPSNNVQVCVVPALNVRPLIPVTAVALEDVAIKTVLPK